MSWDDRQVAMLDAMGLRVWRFEPAPAPVAAASPRAATVMPAAERRAAPVPVPAAVAVAVAAKVAVKDLLPSAPEQPTAPAPSARADVSLLDWSQLTQAVGQCRACGLCEARKEAIFGQGPQDAQWMVVGDIPGEAEDAQGLAMAAAPGELLDNMLRALGLTRTGEAGRAPVFVTNIVKCRPARLRNPDGHELAQCAPLLQRQIELVKPRVILALGRVAAQQMLGTQEALGQLRGRVHQAYGTPVVVSFHPSYLLRSPVDKAGAWQDLCLARRVHQGHRP